MDWIIDNLGDWLFELYVDNPESNIKSIPGYSEYIQWLPKVEGKDYENNSQDVVWTLPNSYSVFLNEKNEYKIHELVKKTEERYPTIKDKISRFGKAEKNPGEKRGRKKGTKNKPKGNLTPISNVVKPTVVSPVMKSEPIITNPETTEPEVSKKEPGVRGKKPTSSTIERIEAEIQKLTDSIKMSTSKIEYLQDRKEYYKKKLGLNENVKRKIVISEQQLMRLIDTNQKSNL
jgi:hypothetical protein